MAKLECALLDSLIKPMAQTPVLSIVVPSFHRPDELVQTIGSLAGQIKDGLEAKVEILISDNGSDITTVETIRALAEAYPSVSFMLNARDEGGFFNFFAAPWRARGDYTWTFGSDDLLADGGVENVVEVLEREQPSFLTMNKQVVDAAVSAALIDNMNSVQSRRFNSFVDLFCALGINQFAFISGQIERSEVARRFDAEPYLRAHTRHPHVAFYLAKYADQPCFYLAANHLVHRNDNSPMLEYHAGNFFDFGVTLPCVLVETIEKIGAPKDLLERVSGYKRITNYDAPDVTLVDAMFENQLRALSFGRYMTVGQKRTIEDMLTHCRPDRQLQFEQIWIYGQHLDELERKKVSAEQALAVARQKALQTSAMFAQSTGG
jgi:glycosyltransferase involved in cell wall biosynthesis